jgi:hypothetical protein
MAVWKDYSQQRLEEGTAFVAAGQYRRGMEKQMTGKSVLMPTVGYVVLYLISASFASVWLFVRILLAVYKRFCPVCSMPGCRSSEPMMVISKELGRLASHPASDLGGVSVVFLRRV